MRFLKGVEDVFNARVAVVVDGDLRLYLTEERPLGLAERAFFCGGRFLRLSPGGMGERGVPWEPHAGQGRGSTLCPARRKWGNYREP